VGFFVGPDLFQGVAPTIGCSLAARRPIQLRMEVLAYVIWFFGDFHEVLFGAGLPIEVVSPEDGSDGAVGEPDGRRTRALGEEDIPYATRLIIRHEGAIQPEVARYMQALRGCVCADTDVLSQCKGQQQSHQKVLPCLHKRCVLAYDKYTPFHEVRWRAEVWTGGDGRGVGARQDEGR